MCPRSTRAFWPDPPCSTVKRAARAARASISDARIGRRGILAALKLVSENQPLRAGREIFVAVGCDHADHTDEDQDTHDPSEAQVLGFTDRRGVTGHRRGGSGRRTQHQSRRSESDKRFTNNHLEPFRLPIAAQITRLPKASTPAIVTFRAFQAVLLSLTAILPGLHDANPSIRFAAAR